MLLTVGVMATAQMLVVTSRHTSYARDETLAVSLAQEIREKVMSESFADLVSMFNGADTDVAGTISLPAAEWAQHVHDNLGPTARGEVSVDTPLEDPAIPNGMVRVSIRISWQQGDRLITVPLSFHVARTGP